MYQNLYFVIRIGVTLASHSLVLFHSLNTFLVSLFHQSYLYGLSSLQFKYLFGQPVSPVLPLPRVHLTNHQLKWLSCKVVGAPHSCVNLLGARCPSLS